MADHGTVEYATASGNDYAAVAATTTNAMLAHPAFVIAPEKRRDASCAPKGSTVIAASTNVQLMTRSGSCRERSFTSRGKTLLFRTSKASGFRKKLVTLIKTSR